VPRAPFESAGLSPGDLMRVEALDDGSLLVRPITAAPQRSAEPAQPTLGSLD
jgi:hypothetical protein